MASVPRLVLVASAAAASGNAPAQCGSSVTLEGMGNLNASISLDGDFYWASYTGGYDVYERILGGGVYGDDWRLLIGVGCQSSCNTVAQTDMAEGKWALSLRGSGEDFQNNELVAVCSEGCPPAVRGAPGTWDGWTASTTWTTPAHATLQPRAITCNAAPTRCRTGITATGFGNVNGTQELDGDYYWDSNSPVNYYTKEISSEFMATISVGCDPQCNTQEQNDMAKGKWTLVLQGNNHHFGFYELVAVCVENCPPAVSAGQPGWPTGVSGTKWQKIGGGMLEPVSTKCCARKTLPCDACDEADCLAHTASFFGMPRGCKSSASSCCYNNHDQEVSGHCACRPVPTECDHPPIETVV